MDAEIQTVYIEGDGFAWRSKERPSADPTPLDPIALRMAIAQPANRAAVYVSRPCQFASDLRLTGCRLSHWTNERFSQQIIDVMSAALDRLKHEGHARSFQLVGYSGGGAVALLLAAQRMDVVRVVTVAGNLDTKAWTLHHGVTSLDGSLNPADAAARLQHVAQVHLVGARDRVMPPSIAQSYVQRFPPGERPQVHVMDNFEHRCCWAESWPQLWSTWVADP
ncbi:MAG: alpha/beta hydrolase [Steroidobacteraceae bacterium]